MTCQECEKIRDEGNIEYAYRWGIATVILIACEKHAK